MPEQQQTRERTPANLSTKYDPKLGETNAKRFQAGVIALLKTSDHKGELALAVLEGRADSSKKCLVQFEPRALDYKKVCEVLKTTGDEAKALQAGKTEARAEKDVKDDEHIAYMMQVLDIKQKLFALLLHNSTDDGKKVFEHLEHDVAQAWDEIITHAPEVPRSTLQSLQQALIQGLYFESAQGESTGIITYSKWEKNQSWKTNLKNMKCMHTTLKTHVKKLELEEQEEYTYALSKSWLPANVD